MTNRDRLSEVLANAVCLHDQAAIEQALDAMAIQLTERLAEAHPLFLCVVIGGIIPLGHLLTRLSFPLEVNYVHATRYRGEQHGHDLKWLARPTCDLKDRTVVVFDDILDGGLTLSGIVEDCKSQGAREVLTAVLADKETAREPGGVSKADFTGLTVSDHYVFGFGLDFEENMRHLPAIYRIADAHQS